MEKFAWLDRVIAAWKSDARCYELIEEMGRDGFSCLVYTGVRRNGSRGAEDVTYCQLRRNDGPGAGLGTQVSGTGAAAARAAICRAYLAFRLRASRNEAKAEPSESLLPKEG